MPDTRRHRGPHPDDERLFAPEMWPALRQAVADLSWLLTRGYAMPSARKLVGDRYQLRERQRIAVMRAACGDQALTHRRATVHPPDELAGRTLLIDGYNLLSTLEAALGGGVLLLSRDGCLRDMASMHGSYRKVAETLPALMLAGQWLRQRGVGRCTWYLDSPVSNSGRLRTIMLDLAQSQAWDWQVELVTSPDHVLIESDELIASADSVILDASHAWVNLARAILTAHPPRRAAVDLRDPRKRGI